MLLQLLFVLVAIIVGARLGGIGLGCDVDDCRRYLCRLLYAGCRRTGLYGEISRTVVAS